MKVIRQDKEALWSIWFIQMSATILYNYSLLLNRLKLGATHFPNIQAAKPHSTTTAKKTCTIDVSEPNKTCTHSSVRLGTDKTSDHNISTEHVHVPLRFATEETVRLKATEQNLNRKWGGFHSRAVSKAAQDNKTKLHTAWLKLQTTTKYYTHVVDFLFYWYYHNASNHDFGTGTTLTCLVVTCFHLF